MKDDAFAGVEVGGGYAERDAQFFEGLHLQDAIEKPIHPEIRSKAITRQSPTCQITESNLGSDFFELGGRDAAAIRGANQRTNAGSGDKADGNIFLFKDFENAHVNDAAGKASSKSKAERRNSGVDSRNRSSGKTSASDTPAKAAH